MLTYLTATCKTWGTSELPKNYASLCGLTPQHFLLNPILPAARVIPDSMEALIGLFVSQGGYLAAVNLLDTIGITPKKLGCVHVIEY